jgi:hypothetical protein
VASKTNKKKKSAPRGSGRPDAHKLVAHGAKTAVAEKPIGIGDWIRTARPATLGLAIAPVVSGWGIAMFNLTILADPRAMQIANDAAQTFERLGSPEGELALAQATIYLAVAAKSNAGYNAYNQAMAFVKRDQSRPVPVHLRNAPTKLMKELGYGHAYRYAHDEPEAYAAGETYLPDGMPDPSWYQPVARGLETKIAEKMAHLRELDRQAKKSKG